MTDHNSKARFSDRVADYVRYRPGYPDELLGTLQRVAGLTPSSVVADIGSGTGISANLFLQLGCEVFAVEPNREMRLAAEERFRGAPQFHSIDATAEATTLADSSIDLIAAGQAFHWFDPEATRREWLRILNPTCQVALFWNNRRTDSTPFLVAYEKLLHEFGTDYTEVNHTRIDHAALVGFFGDETFQTFRFPYLQSFDFDGLKGRLLSSSYAPGMGHPRHEPMLQELWRIFEAYADNGRVSFDYDTELSVGSLNRWSGG
jgi:SAM-dependent methyltransferase